MFVYEINDSENERMNLKGLKQMKKSTKSSLTCSFKAINLTLLNSKISDNIDELIKQINVLINENSEILKFVNPILELMINNTSDLIDSDDADDTDEQNDEISDENVKLSDKFMNLKIKASDAEAVEFAKNEFGMKMDVEDFVWTNLKSTSIYRINLNESSVDLNSMKFGRFIDKLAIKFDRCFLIKPILSDSYKDSLYLITGNVIRDVNESSEIDDVNIPMNYEKYIDFLYSMFSYGLYTLNVVADMRYNTKMTKIEFIKLPITEEYKFIVDKCKNKLIQLGLIKHE